MAVRINNKEISAIRVGSSAIAAVYHGARLVWQAISSCFGSGLWMADRTWKSDDTWRNQ